jgi:hypothetical protein
MLNVISAATLAWWMTTLELVAALSSVTLLMKFQQSRRAVRMTLTMWTITRVMQGWSDMYYGRQLLGLILCVQQADLYNEYFLACGSVVMFVALEILPVMLVIDFSFSQCFAEKPAGLNEPLLDYESLVEVKTASFVSDASRRESLIRHRRRSSVDASNQRETSQNEFEFVLSDRFKLDRKNGLGHLHKIKPSNSSTESVPMLARVVPISKAAPQLINQVLKEAESLKPFKCLQQSITIVHNRTSLFLVYPQSTSLRELIHANHLNSNEKLTIA